MNERITEVAQTASSMTMSAEPVEGTTSDIPNANQPGSSRSERIAGRRHDTSDSDLGDGDGDGDENDGIIEVMGADDDSNIYDIDAEDDIVPHYPKRKRRSVNYRLSNWGDEAFNDVPKRTKLTPAKPASKMRGVIVGIWKNSEQHMAEDKQIVHGFIDDGDRLRFRIHGTNRQHNKTLAIPQGATGCWVKPENIIFDRHLLGKCRDQLKRYVISNSRNDSEECEQSAEHPQDEDLEASDEVEAVTNTQAPAKSEILLGYWMDSSELDPKNKHAVFGTTTSNGHFRFVVKKSTRDGRCVVGNYPHGNGKYQVQFDKIMLEPHLSRLKRQQVEHYILIRQEQLRKSADPDSYTRRMNEKEAVEAAKDVLIFGGAPNIAASETETASPAPGPEQDLRSKEKRRKSGPNQLESSHVTNVPIRKTTNYERQNARVSTEDSDDGTLEENSASHRKASAKQKLTKDMEKLNRRWEAQQAVTPRITETPHDTPPLAQSPMSSVSVNKDDVIVHNDIKYTKRYNSLFEGKHVGPPRVLTIDGEDYVEYRILTKPGAF